MRDRENQQEHDPQFGDEALASLPSVARFARSLTDQVADAEDLVQETYLRAYRYRSQYQPGTSCRAWLFTICRNVHLRNYQRDRRMVVADDHALDAIVSVRGPKGDDEMEELAGTGFAPAVERALDHLPEQFRSAVVLVDVEDQSYDAAAAVLDVPPGTLRSRLFRGRRLLRQALVDYARAEGLTIRPMAAS